MKIVIVGASFAGITCALRAKENYPTADVVLIDKQIDIGYLPSGLSLVLNKNLSSLDEAYFITASELLDKGIELKLNTEVVSYQFEDHLVVSKEGLISFDKLVLATGSNQIPTNLELETKQSLTFKDKASAKRALNQIEQVDRVIVIGAGQAGLELSSALINSGKSVEMIETMDYPLYKYFDQTFLAPFTKHLNQESRLNIHFEEAIKSVNQKEVILSDSNSYNRLEVPVLLATSVRPDLSCFKNQLDLSSDQTIEVDEYMRTSVEDVFAIGDLIQVPSSVLGIPTYIPLIYTALKTAKVCADNLQNVTTPMTPVCQTIVTRLFDYYLGSCGLIEAESFMYPGEIDVVVHEAATSFINQETVRTKIIYDKTSFVILGVQIISKSSIVDKINLYTMMINEKMTLKDLETLEVAYQPSLTAIEVDTKSHQKWV